MRFKNLSSFLKKINNFENIFKNYSDKQLKNNTKLFKQKIKYGVNLDSIIPEAFATVKESCKRIFNIRLFDVQLIGGLVLHCQSVAEMRTGEGKTITSTLPAYLNALTGKGVHIVTVNDYLAKRDAENNRSLFDFLGLSVGITLPNMSTNLKKKAYLSDITYGTNNEYVFDYLRDHMVMHPYHKVQRELHYALIDEIDSILIDEARTPLIISGLYKNRLKNDVYKKIEHLVNKLNLKHFNINFKKKHIYLNQHGFKKIERVLVKFKIIQKEQLLYSTKYIKIIHCINNALKARYIYNIDRDYLVKDKDLLIIDEHTGRIMQNRRWIEGLHLALEAKENLPIKKDNKDLASITFQNYFRLYKKLSGMSGTAISECKEFLDIYQINTISIPTNKPMDRKDIPDSIYLNEDDKIYAIIKEIKIRNKKNQPILLGTTSIKTSQKLSKLLNLHHIKHSLLNAKFNDYEAKIISKAGEPGHVTIATNMAGRGTDIMLGGDINRQISYLINPSKYKIKVLYNKWRLLNTFVKQAGGLHIIGTERHELRRIDNQLIGRSGRQGDPGSSKFYLSIKDNLLLIRFCEEDIGNLINKLSLSAESLKHSCIDKAILRAQNAREIDNFNIRKELLKYDDITNKHRKIIFFYRNRLLFSNDILKLIIKISTHLITDTIINKKYLIKKKQLIININKIFFYIPLKKISLFEKEYINEYLIEHVHNHLFLSKKRFLAKELNLCLKKIFIKTLDFLWIKHIQIMKALKDHFNLIFYTNYYPKHLYNMEIFKLLNSMINRFKYLVLKKFLQLK